MTLAEAWRILHLTPPVTEPELKSAYRQLAKQLHPDRYASFDRKIWAGEKFIRLKEAYDLLRTADLGATTLSPTAPPGTTGSRRTSVFDHYADQSEFTERDFIAWLSLWRFAVAIGRKVARSRTGIRMAESPAFQSALAFGLFVLLIPVVALTFPVAALLAISFAIYLLVQKGVLAMIEGLGGIRIGPDSPRLSGQILYLAQLGLGAALAIPFARYVLTFEDNREWISILLVWAFAVTLVLTWLLETVLFFRARWLRRTLRSELDLLTD